MKKRKKKLNSRRLRLAQISRVIRLHTDGWSPREIATILKGSSDPNPPDDEYTPPPPSDPIDRAIHQWSESIISRFYGAVVLNALNSYEAEVGPNYGDAE